MVDAWYISITASGVKIWRGSNKNDSVVRQNKTDRSISRTLIACGRRSSASQAYSSIDFQHSTQGVLHIKNVDTAGVPFWV